MQDHKLTIRMTQIWAIAFWKDYQLTWFDDGKITAVTRTQIELDDGSLLKRK